MSTANFRPSAKKSNDRHKEKVKAEAAGRWSEIITTLCQVNPQCLDGRHHACPKSCYPDAGGKDRFRALKDFDESGGTICNQCQPDANADGFSTIAWLSDLDLRKDFPKILAAVAKHLGIEQPKSKKTRRDPEDSLDFLRWSPTAATLWAHCKPPINLTAIERLGARYAKHLIYTVIAIPVWGPTLDAAPPVGWVMYRSDGGELPVGPKGPKQEWEKVKLAAGSRPGLIACLDDWKAINSEAAPQTWWKLEGSTDLLSALSVDWPAGHAFFTTANGAKEKPQQWILDALAGCTVNVCHDADTPGQEGATQKSCPMLANASSEVRNICLPFAVEPTHGPDIRDFFKGGGTPATLIEIAAAAPVWEAAGVDSETSLIQEAVDDPHRLARLNLANYHRDHGGTIKYWNGEWWRHKQGRYCRLSHDELSAKVSRSIKAEFDDAWATGRDGADKSRKVSQALVNNVLSATKSLCIVPSSVEMPCWLVDRSKPSIVSLDNGLLDLNAVLANSQDPIRDHSPDWFSQLFVDYSFDPSNTCPLWQNYVNTVMEGDTECIHLLQEWAGYLLVPDNNLQRFICFEGEGGNGKTVFMAGMVAMLGKRNVSHVALEDFAGRFDLYQTLGKALNICGDVGEVNGVAEGRLKTFTDGVPMNFDRKNLSPVSATPTAKIMCAWNNRPRIKDRSLGLWRRMILVPFKRQITESEKVHGMDKPEFWAQKNEVAGIFNWSILGLFRLRQRGDFHIPRAVQAAMNEYRAESNPAAQYLENQLVVSPNQSVDSGEIYAGYVEWCRQSGHKPLADSNFFKELRRKFEDAKPGRYRPSATERRRCCYHGIYWAPDDDE